MSLISQGGLKAMLADKKLGLVLVDHNMPGVPQRWLNDAVCGVVDHHEDVKGFADARLRIVDDKVGSCVSLVAQVMGPSITFLRRHLTHLLIYMQWSHQALLLVCMILLLYPCAIPGAIVCILQFTWTDLLLA